ncbi:oligoendopeptidase F [Candidatus Magnetomorum sp. HK-1]|nr:oligoendopeptidase F [Candidatus Magnetomorum sp. HK-1]
MNVCKWDLKSLYISVDDPQIKNDKEIYINKLKSFSGKYTGLIKELDAEGVFNVIKELEDIQQIYHKFFSYAYLLIVIDNQNNRNIEFWNEVNLLKQYLGETNFFYTEWSNLSDNHVQKLLSSHILCFCKDFLSILRNKKTLSDETLYILNSKKITCKQAWKDLYGKIINDEQLNCSREMTEQAFKKTNIFLKDKIHIISHIYNSLILDKYSTDKLYEYNEWISKRNSKNKMNNQVLQSMINILFDSKNLLRKYYSIKKKYLGVNKFNDFNMYEALHSIKEDRFEIKNIRTNILKIFPHQTSDIINSFFKENRINLDLSMKRNKGAFCHRIIGGDSYIFLNYANDLSSFIRLAHELGHGVHFYCLKDQFSLNNISLLIGEIPSFVFELIGFWTLIEKSSSKKRFNYLCSMIESIFYNIYCQLIIHSFEEKIHLIVREQNNISYQEISQIWISLHKNFYADAIEFTDYYKLRWALCSHIFYAPGYVYSYAFACLISLSFFDDYIHNKEKFENNFFKWMKLSSSDIKKSLSIHANHEFDIIFKKGLVVLENFIKELENGRFE